MYVGISNTCAHISANLLNLPTIVTASSPSFYWNWHLNHNKNIILARMRFEGDYEYITNRINKFL
jgi:hypothetical protein